MRATRSKSVHLQGTEDARAVCGFDWMATFPRHEAVSWTNRVRVTCTDCLVRARELILKLELGKVKQ